MSDGFAAALGVLHAGWRTDPGRARTNNEDLPLVDASRGVYGVIDGVGGQAAGEVAAAIARDVIVQRLARPLGTASERVREALAIANNEIFKRAGSAPELHGMACVVTLAIVGDGTLTIGHVGDTRLYKLRPDGLRKLTHDHSPVGEREDARELSEIDAMRHPRRNEVFRDLGSAHRDKDEDDFVEVIVEPFESDCAILLCSDGLTDMVSSATIERLVERHAGSPQDVADALVSAANEAGGKDNITVVYAEAPEFADRVLRRAPSPDVVDPAASRYPHSPAPDDSRTTANTTPASTRRPNAGGTSWPHRVAQSRTTWFSLGALAGVALALAGAWRLGSLTIDGSRTLVVDPNRTTAYSRISEAMAVARPNDVVRLEPGTYPERVTLLDGVDLVARIPGTATIVRPSHASGEVVGISVYGGGSSTVSGINLESTPALPMDIGIRIAGQGVTIEQAVISGAMRAGVEVAPAAAATVRGSWFTVQGPAFAVGDEAQATLIGNTVLRTGRTGDPPFALAPSSQPHFRRNVFAGFGTEVVKSMPAAVRQQLLAGNYVIAGEPSLLR